MDLPPSLSKEQSARTKVGASNALRLFNETVKFWLRFYENLTLKALLLEYGGEIQTRIDDIVRRRRTVMTEGNFIKISAEVDIEVEMRCLPILNGATLRELFIEGTISGKTYIQHLAANTGIPENQLQVPPKPVEEQPPAKRRKKATLEEQLQP
jgi:hypothetical protein